MPIIKENFNLSSYIRLLPFYEKEKLKLEKKIIDWKLESWEDALIFQLFPFDSHVVRSLEDLNRYDLLLNNLRTGESYDWTAEKVKQISLKKIAMNPNGKQEIGRIVYEIINFGKKGTALAVIRKILEEASAGINFFDLEADKDLFLKRVYIILFCHFFNNTEESQQYLFLNGGLFVIAIQMGFDMEEIIKSQLEFAGYLFDSRKKICLNFAAAINDNDTVIGPPNENGLFSVYHWVKLFFIFSRKEMNHSNLEKFLEDKKFFSKITAEEKYLIAVILKLYLHLLDGTIMGINAEELTSKKPQSTVLITTAILSGPLTKDDKKEIQAWFGQVSAEQAEGYIANIIKLKELDHQNEPLLSNLLQVNDMYMEFYKKNEPFFYYDEMKKGFCFSNY